MSLPATALGLAAWQERRGARRGELAGGGEAALDYGDPSGEARALTEGCGLVDLSWHGRLVVRGADRRRFLNAYLTCEVKDLAAGSGARGFFTNAQGRILADAVIGALEDRLLVLLPPGRGAAIGEHLARFVLADRVELDAAPGLVPLALVGPRTDEVLTAAGAPVPPAPWGTASWSAFSAEAAAQRQQSWHETPYLICWVGAEDAVAAAERLVTHGARPAGVTALEILRVECGVPRFGVDYDEGNFPQETGLEDAVSFTKGCYLGQEVVARIHYRGHVNKRLCGIVFDPGVETAPPRSGEPLLRAGEQVGRLGTVVESPRLGRTIALAMLREAAAEPDTTLQTVAGTSVRVTSLPYLKNNG